MKHKEIALIIDNGGETEHIFDDEFNKKMLNKDEIKSVTRASHVEPDPEDLGTWYIDLAPVGGPVKKGFETREDALKAEVEWLMKNYYIIGDDAEDLEIGG